MGNRVSAAIAVIFMDRLEQTGVRPASITLHKSHLDDMCILTTDGEEAESVMRALNQQYADIKFEMDRPDNERSLRLLDFEFNISSEG